MFGGGLARSQRKVASKEFSQMLARLDGIPGAETVPCWSAPHSRQRVAEIVSLAPIPEASSRFPLAAEE